MAEAKSCAGDALDRRAFLAAGAIVAGATLLPRRPIEAAPRRKEGLESFIRTRLRRSHCPGLGVAVIFGGRIVYSDSFGLAHVGRKRKVDEDTSFLLASISKTVTGVALLQTWERGLIDLDADVNDVLDFPVRNPRFMNEPITARQLLTHTSSIRDRWSVWNGLYSNGDSPIELGDFLRSYLDPEGKRYRRANFTKKRPDARYEYSNIGAALAGYLVEAVSGTPFDEWCETNIFEPLGMKGTGWRLEGLDRSDIARPYRYRHERGDWTPYGLYGYPDYPDGLLRATPNDMAAFLIAIANGGAYSGERILKRATVREMLTDQLSRDQGGWQGLVWYRIRPRGLGTLYGHNGSDKGVRTEMYMRRKDGAGVVLLANANAYRYREDAALSQIRDRLLRDAESLAKAGSARAAA